MIGNSPLPRLCSRRCTRFIASPDHWPGPGLSVERWALASGSPLQSLLGRSCRDRCGGGSASDSPDEAGEFAGDRDDGDGLELAFPDQRTIAPVQPALRLPGNLANRWRRRIDLRLLGFSD